MVLLSWPAGIAVALLITLAVAALWWLGGRVYEGWQTAIKTSKALAGAPLRLGSLRLWGTGWSQALLVAVNRMGFALWRLLLLIAWPFLVVLALPVGDGLPQAFWGFVEETARALWANIVAYAPNLVRIALIVIVIRVTLGVIRWIFEEIRRGRIRLRNFDRSWARQTYGLIRMAFVALGAILIFPFLPGSGSTGFQGIAIFIGALVSLGASSAVSNAVAGIVLTYTKAFETGDRVNIHDVTGDIVDRTLFVTRIRTIKNEEIAIPNQLVLAGPIINYSNDAGGNGVAVEIRIGLGYDVPWREVHRLLKEAATHEGILKEPAPRIYQDELGDFAVSYTLHAFVEDPKTMLAVRSLVMQRAMDLFAAAGIEITSPEHMALRNAGTNKPGDLATLSVEPVQPPGTDSTEMKPDVPVDPTAPPPKDDLDDDPAPTDDPAFKKP